MPTPEQVAENRAAFEAAQAEAEATGGTVCGTWDRTGRPRYFVVPKETQDRDVVDHAFTLKNERPMSDGERALLLLTEERLGRLAQPQSGLVELTSGA